ncbi:MAG: S-adenosylmethionine decarboxylase [Parcubacteria group bacterium]|nr:S-adenosylmethionine decarboxylase [Parcubacteria group bacterium]
MEQKNTNNKEEKFGVELVLDLFGCDPEAISSKERITAYARELCNLIEMKPFGEPFVEKFGFGKDFTAGYSLVQLIETSSITGHFSEFWGKAYINIFSCAEFDAEKAAAFTIAHFGAKGANKRILVRK